MQSFHRRSAGFTLVELIVVIAIIGILAALAIPKYDDYLTRAYLSERLLLASSAKNYVAETYASEGNEAFMQLSNGNSELGFSQIWENGIPILGISSDGTIGVTTQRKKATIEGAVRLRPMKNGIYYPLNKKGNSEWSGEWQCTVYDFFPASQLPRGCVHE